MPRKGQAFPVDDDWRRRAIARRDELGLTTADIAREAKCPRSLVYELLELDKTKTQRHQTTYLPEIHEALKWGPPQKALAPGEVPELSYMYSRLDERGKAAVIAAARKELDRIIDSPSQDAPRRSGGRRS